MIAFIQSQILLYFAILLVMFLPGYLLLLAIFGKSRTLEPLERFVLSFGMSIITVDFIAFSYSRLHIPIAAISSIIGIIAVTLAFYIAYKKKKDENIDGGDSLFSYSKNQLSLFFLLIFLTIFVKASYLQGTVMPTATDMGHHMYWAKWMAENHALSEYEGMPDFIIGEHISFAIINMISGADFFSAFPVVILLLINILGILTVYILTLRIFKNQNMAILSTLFLGVLYAVSAPQAKYVSGGVIGNIFGNYFLPVCFYFYYRAFEFLNGNSTSLMEVELSKSRKFLSSAIFMTTGLFYTHHLTSFIFLFIWALIIPVFMILNYRNIEQIFRKIRPIIFSPVVLGVLFLGITYFFFVFTPTYVNGSAVGTAVGSAEKSTRIGLSFNELKQTVGESRLALGLIGMIMLLVGFRRRDIGYYVIFSWAMMLIVMSSFPKILFIDLPSNRIGNYLTYPFAILSAFGFMMIFSKKSSSTYPESGLPKTFLRVAFLSVFTYVLITGVSDSTDAFKAAPASSRMIETFSASRYLSVVADPSEMVLKDHNYLIADAWMKLYFMRGYKYPLSRGYFKRYEDQSGNREKCTLHMISNPGGEDAKRCFSETKTDLIAVNPNYDSAQFEKLGNFDGIYSSNNISIFYRK